MLDYLILFRFNNSFTAISNIIAGYYLSCFFVKNNPGFENLIFLCGATFFLYTAGIILNDITDIEKDKRLYPNRPLASGRIKTLTALSIASCFVVISIFLSVFVNIYALLFCSVIFSLILLYNYFLKRYKLAGSINMGLIRGLNFLLGTSASYSSIADCKFYLNYSLFVFIYVLLITLISFYEEESQKKSIIAFYLLGIIFSILYFPILVGFHISGFFLILLCAFILIYSGIKYFILPSTKSVSLCVKNGIMGIIFLDSAILMGNRIFLWGVLVALFSVPAILIGKYLRID